MCQESKPEYLLALWRRYQRVGRRFKSKILDECCAVGGDARNYAMALLHRKPRARQKKPGPKKQCAAAVRAPLKAIWLLSEQRGSKRLQAALPIWWPFSEQAPGPLAPAPRKKLLRRSAASRDRLLKKARAPDPRKGRGGTRRGPEALKRRIPIRTDHWDIDQPGFLEADAGAPCGDSLAGEFVWRLTFTDLFSPWTENRAVWNKRAAAVVEPGRDVEQALPFSLKGFDVDNGSEFLTWHRWRCFLERPAPGDLRRSRPSKKNDQAHVEQPNWTPGRQLLGDERMEGVARVKLINALSVTWGWRHNGFRPTLKLASKTRVGARTIRQ